MLLSRETQKRGFPVSLRHQKGFLVFSFGSLQGNFQVTCWKPAEPETREPKCTAPEARHILLESNLCFAFCHRKPQGKPPFWRLPWCLLGNQKENLHFWRVSSCLIGNQKGNPPFRGSPILTLALSSFARVSRAQRRSASAAVGSSPPALARHGAAGPPDAQMALLFYHDQSHPLLWMDKILHHFETKGHHRLLVFAGESSFKGFSGVAGLHPSTVCDGLK